MINYNEDSTIQNQIVRINNTLNFIEQHLDQDLSLEVLAPKASYSPFHFHRLFSNLIKETPHAFVTRKRIEKIAWLLLKHKNKSIKELALKYGFDSPVSFSKAFKKYYGISASELRKLSISRFNKIIYKNSKIGKERIIVEEYLSNTKYLKKWMTSNARVSPKAVPTQHFVAIRSQGDFELSYQAFGKLKTWAASKKIFEKQVKQWILAIHDNPAITEASRISHSAGLKIQKGYSGYEEEMSVLTIPKGRFLVGSFELAATEFQLAWAGMSVYLMDQGYIYRDGFYFEIIHGEQLFQKNQKHLVEIYIPIE